MRKPITDNFQSLMMGKYLGEQYKQKHVYQGRRRRNYYTCDNHFHSNTHEHVSKSDGSRAYRPQERHIYIHQDTYEGFGLLLNLSKIVSEHSVNQCRDNIQAEGGKGGQHVRL